jgi:hypothetical protein
LEEAAVDEADNLARGREDDGRIALAFLYFATEKEEIDFGEIVFFVDLDEAENLGGGPILHAKFVRGSGADVCGMKRAGDDGERRPKVSKRFLQGHFIAAKKPMFKVVCSEAIAPSSRRR